MAWCPGGVWEMKAMRQTSRWWAALVPLAIVFFALAIPRKGHACGFCVNLKGFTLSHPRSIEIAVATRGAIEKGILVNDRAWISTEKVLGEGNSQIALRKVPASRLVEAWAKRHGFADRGGPVTVHFLFIASREACGIEIRKGVVHLQTKPSQRCDLRVVTTKQAMAAILEGRMSLSEARRWGLLVVEGDGPDLPLR
jgi:hypothetical protein